MGRLSGVELLAGWLATITGVGLMLLLWLSGAILSQSVFFIFGIIFLVIAVGVTVEATTDARGARILLALGTLTLAGVFVISFIITLAIPTLLAIVATVIAFVRPHHDHAVAASSRP